LRRRDHGGGRLHARRDATIDVMTIGAGVDVFMSILARVYPLPFRPGIMGDPLLSFF
jgi:hypothetical protein